MKSSLLLRLLTLWSSYCRTNLDLGVRISDGDGTVPLISLGTMCRKHWQQPELNPHNISVITREYKHELSWEKNSTATAAFNYMNPLHQYEKFRRFKRFELSPRTGCSPSISVSVELHLRNQICER